MNFNSDPSRKAQELIFSRKVNNVLHPPLTFNNVDVGQISSQKHLGMFPDFKLSFNEHLETVFAKVNRGIAILRKLQTVLPREALLTIYKSFIRPHFDYGDVIYDQSYKDSFHAKLESYQYKAALAMTGAINGSSTEKLYQELGIEHLRLRRWFRKLCLFYKIIKSKSPPYLFNLIPRSSRLHTTRNPDNITPFKVRHNFFRNSFFPSVISEWNKLDLEIRNSASLEIFNPLGLKLLTRLRIGFSHLKEHKFKHNFQDSVDPLCSCGNDIESTVHFFLHRPNFTTQRQTLLNKLKSINASIMTENENSVLRTLLSGRPDFSYSTNKEIINVTISFILTIERFNCPFFKN